MSSLFNEFVFLSVTYIYSLYEFVTWSFSSNRLDQDIPPSASSSSVVVSGMGSLCSRTFITFSDDEAFETAFPLTAHISPTLPIQEVCPVTHNPALYRDPVTDITYADARAFRIIREAYRKYIAAHGFPNDSTQAHNEPAGSSKNLRLKGMTV